MKKLLSLLLAIALCASALLVLSACDENDAKGAFEELNAEEWKEALSAPNFENVTIKYEYTMEGALQKQVAKVTKDGVYRSIVAVDANGNESKPQGNYFEGENATVQRNLFLKTFLAIVEDRENFEYNKETHVYTVKAASARIDQAEGVYVTENAKDGQLTFNENGQVEKFVCTLTEAIYLADEKKQETTVEVTWTFSDYGTTEITATEKEASGMTSVIG